MNDEYADVNVQAQERDPDSVLNYYKKLLHIRKQHPLMVWLIVMIKDKVVKHADRRFPVVRSLYPHQCE
jgi:glycosidase